MTSFTHSPAPMFTGYLVFGSLTDAQLAKHRLMSGKAGTSQPKAVMGGFELQFEDAYQWELQDVYDMVRVTDKLVAQQVPAEPV